MLIGGKERISGADRSDFYRGCGGVLVSICVCGNESVI